MFTEPDRKQEVIHRAQFGSLMAANGNREPQDKTPKKQSPTSATRPKKYALEMWVEIKTSAGMHSTSEEDSYSVDFTIDTINHAYPGCTGMYLGVAGHMLAFMERRQTQEQAFFSAKLLQPVKQLGTFPPGWDTLLGGECGV